MDCSGECEGELFGILLPVLAIGHSVTASASDLIAKTGNEIPRISYQSTVRGDDYPLRHARHNVRISEIES